MSTASDEIEKLRKRQEALLAEQPRKLWQSIGDLSKDWSATKAVRAQEFLEEVPETPEAAEKQAKSEPISLSRRRFMQWMGAATTALTTTACKRRPVDHLIPYVNKPEGFTYGVPVWYASSSADGLGVLVKTREGRPIKLEGNPDHPVNQGGLDAWTQASVFSLYHPERLKAPMLVSSRKQVSWQEVDDAVKTAIKTARPGGVRLLTGSVVSPTLKSVIDEFTTSTKAEHHVAIPVYFPTANAIEKATGQRIWPTLRFEKADVVVSIDADFLGTWGRSVEAAKGFSSRRKIHINGGKDQNRLFVFESVYSTTGVSADHRHSIRPSQQNAVLLALFALVQKDIPVDAAFKNLVSGIKVDEVVAASGIALADLQRAAKALVEARGKSLVLVGTTGPKAADLEMLALALNHSLKNIGSTMDFDQPMFTGYESGETFTNLVKDLEAGSVDVLIIQGVNPVFSHRYSEIEKHLSKVKLIVSMASELHETAMKSTYVVPESHFLEAWGDASIRAGVYSVQQPAIEPLFDSRSLGEALVAWTRGKLENYREIVRAYAKKSIFSGAAFEEWWKDRLRTGVYVSAARKPVLNWKWSQLAANINAAHESAQGVEVFIHPAAYLLDGQHASNAWLQELPEPLTKVVWTNYAALSPAMANKLGVHDPEIAKVADAMVEVNVQGKTLELPAVVLPGLHPEVVAVSLGYGRTEGGELTRGVGKDAGVWISKAANNNPVWPTKADVKKSSNTYWIASTQKQFGIQGRDEDILHQTTLADFLTGEHHQHEHESISMYATKEWVYPGQKWGMSIDLNSCTGCQACVVACYVENNVPVVGEDQVQRGRHMAWLRIDQYFLGDAANPEATFEPMLCQQCEKAPCETVCPVLATLHSSDGLNDMVYNRCVGTRYCANNCAWKVRRFNYFQYSDKIGNKIDASLDPMPLHFNPDVTVRSRGIMEKCTFCVQRIRTTISESGANRMSRIPDGSIKTACQQSCPTHAIVFGDLNDPDSEVSKLAAKSQSFRVLEVLNTKPSVSYLPRIRNKGSSTT